ncbi:MAG: DUF4326 domain-containing protein [Janthinobacterium lividum]
MGYLSDLLSKQEDQRTENTAVASQGLILGGSQPSEVSLNLPGASLVDFEARWDVWKQQIAPKAAEEKPLTEVPRREMSPLRVYLSLVEAAKAGMIPDPQPPGLILSRCESVPDVNAFVMSTWVSLGRWSRQKKALQVEMSAWEPRWLEKEFAQLARIEEAMGHKERWLAAALAYWTERGSVLFPSTALAASAEAGGPRVLNQGDRYWTDGAVFVGRPGPFGNPFIMHSEGERDSVCDQFEVYATERLKAEPGWLDPLRGKDLVCFCAPKRCHGDILLKLANRSVV